jgi:hypothetical protein
VVDGAQRLSDGKPVAVAGPDGKVPAQAAAGRDDKGRGS